MKKVFSNEDKDSLIERLASWLEDETNEYERFDVIVEVIKDNKF